MESHVRIKSTAKEMEREFRKNPIFSIRMYELEDDTLYNQLKDTDTAIFKAIIRHTELAKELQNRVYTIKGLERAILNAPREKPKIKLIEVLDYNIPYYGNKHIFPYGTLLIETEEGNRMKVKTQEKDGTTFIKVGGFTYYIGGLSPTTSQRVYIKNDK